MEPGEDCHTTGPATRRLGRSSPFTVKDMDWHTEPQPRLKVTGKRLDSPAPPLLSDQANNGWVKPEQTAMVTGINFPTLGCWEITGRYQDDELTFVVWVAK